MPEMTRRGFLGRLFGASATVALAPIVGIAEPAIWVPDQGKKELSLAKSIIRPDQMTCGYMIDRESLNFVNLRDLSKDCLDHFPDEIPVVIIPDIKGISFGRFLYRGTKETLKHEFKVELLGGFDSGRSFAWLAQNNFKGLRRA